jgi:plasmid maintenance system antidote protein VapI
VLLARAFETSPEFWMNLQAMHDLSKAMLNRRLKSVRRLRQASSARTPTGA